jgi:hypothetical protein
MNPSEYLRWMNDQSEADAAARRKAAQEKGLAAARAARKAKAERRATRLAAAIYHMAPKQATEGYVLLRAACGKIIPPLRCYSPGAATLRIFSALEPANRCQECMEWWATWVLLGPARPMTIRRFNEFKRQETRVTVLSRQDMKDLDDLHAVSTAREAALLRALEALSNRDMEHAYKGNAADYLIQLIGHEERRRSGTVTPEETERMATVSRALCVELVRMGLPAEVLAALR